MNDSKASAMNSLSHNRSFLENVWVLRISLFLCSIIPVIGLVSYLEIRDIFSLVTIVPILLLMMAAIDLFDSGWIPSLSRPGRFYGILFKLLGIGHAIFAMRAAYEFFEGSEVQGYLAELQGLRYAFLAVLWVIAALGYLSGDALLRRA